MGLLTSSPSGGQSEVLETLHYQGAITNGIPLFRVGPMVSHRYGGDEDREGSDPQFEADVLTVLASLQTADFVVGYDSNGNPVDLTVGTPPGSTRIALTGAGRAQARHARPRPRVLTR
jgi:hypothetical protein